MPLSENEQRLLDEMERNLYKNEADVMSTSGLVRAPNYTAIGIGVVVGLVGIVTMIIGVYADVTLVGILGFAVLFSGVLVAATVPAKPSVADVASRTTAQGRAPSQASLMDRLKGRWDRRQGGGNLWPKWRENPPLDTVEPAPRGRFFVVPTSRSQ